MIWLNERYAVSLSLSLPTSTRGRCAMPDFTVTHLDDDQLGEAYALVRAAAPDVSAERWHGFARMLRARDGGVLGAFAGDSTLHGIAAYRPETCLRGGLTLNVDALVTFELNRASPARAALCRALDLLGHALGCASVTVTMPGRGYADPASARARGWAGLGLALDSVVFKKNLAPTLSVGEADEPEASARSCG